MEMAMLKRYKKICVWKETGKQTMYLVEEIGSKRVWMKKIQGEDKYILYRKLCDLHNEHLLQIKEAYLEQGQCIVIEEFVNGETLQERIDQSETNTIPVLQALAWMYDICDGVSILHRAKIIHRDINPNNIMITVDGTVKVCDYDISRIYQKEKSGDTEILGTQGYTAPEQFGYGQTDEKSDIYSLGVLLNRMLTGNTLERMYTGVPMIQQIISQATSLESAQRFSNVSAMQKEIKRVYKQLEKQIVQKKHSV